MDVLFVCIHHVARSPMAAGLFNDLAGASSRHCVRSVGYGRLRPAGGANRSAVGVERWDYGASA
jgi:protein-tyrosine-phosphatase